MKKTKFSLANTKLDSQVFACLVFDKHNIRVDIKKIRQDKLRLWFSNKPIPEKEKSYISQLLNGKASFGEKAARRLEKTYEMPNMYLDEFDTRSLGIDMTKITVEKLEFIKKLADMDDDEFRETTELYIAADEVTKARKRTNKDPNE